MSSEIDFGLDYDTVDKDSKVKLTMQQQVDQLQARVSRIILFQDKIRPHLNSAKPFPHFKGGHDDKIKNLAEKLEQKL